MGLTVIVADVDEPAATDSASRLAEESNGQAIGIQVDVADQASGDRAGHGSGTRGTGRRLRLCGPISARCGSRCPAPLGCRSEPGTEKLNSYCYPAYATTDYCDARPRRTGPGCRLRHASGFSLSRHEPGTPVEESGSAVPVCTHPHGPTVRHRPLQSENSRGWVTE
jgi:hypothetical protein